MLKKFAFKHIQYINIFERITRVRPEDCFNYGSALIFVVASEKLSKAIGQGGANPKKLSEMLKRKVKIIRSTQDKEEFVKALVYPVKFREMQVDGNTLKIKAGPQSKAMLIGRNAERLKELREILERYFKIGDVRVV